jgi:hypothetical protein
MNQTTLSRSPEEIVEIEKHKYFLSEQAGYDVGWDVAEQDWESNHAEQFRRSTRPISQKQPARPNRTLFSRLLAKARVR